MPSTLGKRLHFSRHEGVPVASLPSPPKTPSRKRPGRPKKNIALQSVDSKDDDTENSVPRTPSKKPRLNEVIMKTLPQDNVEVEIWQNTPKIYSKNVLKEVKKNTEPAYTTPIHQRLLSGQVNTSNSPNNFSSPTIYTTAKSLFRRTALPTRLVGRQAEREIIVRFLKEHVLKLCPGCLYISGQPGTGKTALLGEILREFEHLFKSEIPSSSSVKIIVLNCMSIKEPHGVFEKLAKEILGEKGIVEKDVVAQTENIILGEQKEKIMYLVILDEIDHLLTKDQDVLYKLFTWPTFPTARLTLIGIANALDLTDRFLPRLRAKNCEPQLLNFNPYNVAEIIDIIRDRLFSLMKSDNALNVSQPFALFPDIPLIEHQAIEFCARKVAAATGDLRKALDVCRQAIEMVEAETKEITTVPPLGERIDNNQNSSAIVHPIESTLKKAPKVTIIHIQKVLSTVFGSSAVQKIRALGFEHRVLLCCLAIKIRTQKKDVTLRKSWEFYVEKCRSTGFTPVKKESFLTLIEMLDVTGLVGIGKGKEEMERKVGLRVSEEEVINGVEDVEVLKKLISIQNDM